MTRAGVTSSSPHSGCSLGLFCPVLSLTPCSAAGVLVCLLEYPRSKRKKGSTMERW